MKNWKKRMAAALLTAVMAAGVVANATPASAATLTAKQYLTKMEKASKKAKSYEKTQIMMNNYTYQGQTVNQKVTYKFIIHMNPLQRKVVITNVVKSDGVEQSQKVVSYVRENSDGTITEYDSVDGGEFQETDVTDSMKDSEEPSEHIYSNAKIERKSVKVNKVDTVKISYQIKGDNLKEVFPLINVNEDQLVELGVDMKAIKPAKGSVWLNKKTYCPVKEIMDLTDVVNSINAQLTELGLQEKLIHSVCKYTISYSKFDKARTIKFPEV